MAQIFSPSPKRRSANVRPCPRSSTETERPANLSARAMQLLAVFYVCS